MTHDHDHEIDRLREDRTVEYLRARGVFGASAGSSVPPRAASAWRVPLVAAAAVVVVTLIGVMADLKPRTVAHAPVPAAPAPKLLVWY